jgi:phage repressor protein C with HTH and peptisase S24 domain
MLSHLEIWTAIDALADRYDLSTSGLAKLSGLDSTSFNKSKRIAPDGKPRWPSTESIAKVLNATGASLDEFMTIITSKQPNTRQLPYIGLVQAAVSGFFDARGLPVGNDWDEVNFPSIDDEKTYAIEITGNSMLPLYREGDVVVVSPNAAIRRGDRVVVKTTAGEVLAKELKRRTNKSVELCGSTPEQDDRLIPIEEIDWIARIVWASQ